MSEQIITETSSFPFCVRLYESKKGWFLTNELK